MPTRCWPIYRDESLPLSMRLCWEEHAGARIALSENRL
jgi:hypothetical protein